MKLNAGIVENLDIIPVNAYLKKITITIKIKKYKFKNNGSFKSSQQINKSKYKNTEANNLSSTNNYEDKNEEFFFLKITITCKI